MKSLKLLSQKAVEVLTRYGYSFSGKINNYNNSDVRIYTKSFNEGCTVTTHQGVEGSLIIEFHTQFFNAVPSGIFVMKYLEDATTVSVTSDLTPDRKYKCVLRALCEVTKQEAKGK